MSNFFYKELYITNQVSRLRDTNDFNDVLVNFNELHILAVKIATCTRCVKEIYPLNGHISHGNKHCVHVL